MLIDGGIIVNDKLVCSPVGLRMSLLDPPSQAYTEPANNDY